jgi:hypothetical protein
MKKVFLITVIFSIGILNAQSFDGKNDSKFQVGANLQANGSGLNIAYDYGVGDNISIGVSSTYLLGVKDELNADFGERFDLKARFNANLGNVLNIDQNFDFYPGLSLGLKNFGGHIGARYFFSEGFGIYSEFGFPLAKYKTENLTPAELLHNQSYFNIGAVFNLE